MATDSYSEENVPIKETSFAFSNPSNHNTFLTPAVFAQGSTSPPSAIILCHGFLSDKDSRTNRRLTELLVPQGIATLRFDWYGMGQSQERFENIGIRKCLDQLDGAFQWLRENGIEQVGLMGSSFGGLIALLSASKTPTLAALALKCPVVDFPEVLRLEFGLEALEHWKQHNQIPDILGGTQPIPLQYSFFEESLQFIAYPKISDIQAPTLIVHGDQDDLIPQHQIDGLFSALPQKKRLDLLPGADHRFGRPEDFRIMTNRISQWMTEHLPSP